MGYACAFEDLYIFLLGQSQWHIPVKEESSGIYLSHAKTCTSLRSEEQQENQNAGE